MQNLKIAHFLYTILRGIFADFFTITIKLHLTVSTPKEQFYIFKF